MVIFEAHRSSTSARLLTIAHGVSAFTGSGRLCCTKTSDRASVVPMAQNAPASPEPKPRSQHAVLPIVIFFLGLALFVLIAVSKAIYFVVQYSPLSTTESVQFRPLTQVVVSLALLAATLFVILSKRYAPKDKHWAYATVGLILGFWLRP